MDIQIRKNVRGIKIQRYWEEARGVYFFLIPPPPSLYYNGAQNIPLVKKYTFLHNEMKYYISSFIRLDPMLFSLKQLVNDFHNQTMID